jgi:hypothetical protein
VPCWTAQPLQPGAGPLDVRSAAGRCPYSTTGGPARLWSPQRPSVGIRTMVLESRALKVGARQNRDSGQVNVQARLLTRKALKPGMLKTRSELLDVTILRGRAELDQRDRRGMVESPGCQANNGWHLSFAGRSCGRSGLFWYTAGTESTSRGNRSGRFPLVRLQLASGLGHP